MSEGNGRKKTAAKKKAGLKRKKKAGTKAAKPSSKRPQKEPESLVARMTELAEAFTGDLATGAWKLAARAGAMPLQKRVFIAT